MMQQADNRTKMSLYDPATQQWDAGTTYTYSARNELTRRVVPSDPPEEYYWPNGDWRYEYDLRGNLTKRFEYHAYDDGYESYEWEEAVAAYEWDSQNRLTQVSNGNTIQYKYDAFGRRIGKKVNAGAWRKYFYDGLQVVAEGTGTNDKIYYTHSDSPVGGIICRDNNGTKYWYHYDHIGNVVAVTDADGNPVVSYAMEAFGGVVAVGQGDSFYHSASTVQPYYLTTKEWDSDVSLYYFNARWYDPGTGRFLCADFADIRYAQDKNRYSYCSNRPTYFIDPDGWDTCTPEDLVRDRKLAKECLRWAKRQPKAAGACGTTAESHCSFAELKCKDKNLKCCWFEVHGFPYEWHGTGFPYFNPCLHSWCAVKCRCVLEEPRLPSDKDILDWLRPDLRI